MAPHKCTRECQRKSSTEKTPVNCMYCQNLCYIECFNISINKFTQKTFFKTSSPVQFICPRCRDVALLLRQFIQQSKIDKSPSSSVATSTVNDGSPNVIEELRKITNKLDNIQTNNKTLNDENNYLKNVVNENLNKICEDFRSLNGHAESVSCKFDNNKLKSLLETHSERLSTQISTLKPGCNAKIFTRDSLGVNSNTLGWSFSALNKSRSNPHSAISNDTRPDLFQLWHSFESNTWISFDAISNSLKLQKEQLASIQRTMGLEDIAHTNSKVKQSALVAAIEQDSSHSERVLEFQNDISDLKMVVDKITETVKSFDQKVTEVTKILSDNNEKAMESAVLDIMIDGSDQSEDLNSQPSPPNHDSPMAVSINLSENDFHDDSLDDLRILHRQLISNCNVNNNFTSNISSNRGCTTVQQNDNVMDKVSTDQFNGCMSMAKPKFTHHLYLSKFETNVSTEMIGNYLLECGINGDSFRINRLQRADTNLQPFTFVSFKIDATDETANIISDNNFWPNKCEIKEFEIRNRNSRKKVNTPPIVGANFLRRRQTNQQT